MERTLYRFAAVEIDTAQRSILTAEGPLHLRARTFDLLVYLIDHRERVVPRQELRDQLWPGVQVTENSVMQCVNEVRKALGDDPREPRYIRTVAKGGYQFICDVTIAALGQPSRPSPIPGAEPATAPAVPMPRKPKNRRLPVGIFAAATIAILAIAVLFSRPTGPAELPWWEAAWWKLDEGAGTRTVDQSGALAGSVPDGVSWTPGVAGSALLFQRPEVAVQGRDEAKSLPVGVAARTLTAIVRIDRATGDHSIIFQTGDMDLDSGTDHFFLGLHQTGAATFGNRNMLIGRTRIQPGRWTHLAGVFEGGDQGVMRLYVDGQEEASGKAEGLFTPSVPIVHPHWAIGRQLRGGTSLHGAIDDVRVYARAIRPAEVRALHHCQAGVTDLKIADTDYYFSPVYSNEVELVREASEGSSRLRNGGQDYAGVAFISKRAGCGLSRIRAADIGQDLRIEAEYRFPKRGDGLITEAGPFFRSRGAAPSDGLIGGTSAGFWVQMFSDGRLRVMRLYPPATIAFIEKAPPAWNPEAWHKLIAEVRGNSLQVNLEGKTIDVTLDAKWETASPLGSNRGGAGIAFGASHNRGLAGGQEVRNIVVERLQ